MDDEEERMRIEEIREIDLEELQFEEVDEADLSSSDNDQPMAHGNDRGGADYGNIIRERCLVSMHNYLGTVDDIPCVNFLDSGAILNLPIFYLEGVVIFPTCVLSLRAIKPSFKACVEKALNQIDGPGTIGVVHVHKDPDDESMHISSVGTTVEIRQCRQFEDGSFDVFTIGKQRFHLQERWVDGDGAPCAEVQIIQEDFPMRTPRNAFGQLASVPNFWNCRSSRQVPPDASHVEYISIQDNNDSDCLSESSFENDLSPAELALHQFAIRSCKKNARSNESISSEGFRLVCEFDQKSRRSCTCDTGGSSDHKYIGKSINNCVGTDNKYQSVLESKFDNNEGWKMLVAGESKWSRRAPRAFWPHWVYRMYDSYFLAQRATVMWKQIIGNPSMDDFAKKPDLLSFSIASKIPVSDSLKQELLEIDGISYRLRREIQLLECLDRVCCKTCQSLIAKRSEMLVMSSDGPLGAYMSIPGYVQKIMTFRKVDGLALIGHPSEECCWFPGYAWTIATCTVCESFVPITGWLFTATDKTLKPDSFWGILISQVAANMW
ncbi:cereblon [Thalictrum thalictroides]|uniref:Cereblon n=1 Tax=Thalictrum thalictroides TaxID=46969 RepID=A0A7J6USF7_THATH|nr:cereblon [Thalictrum thalictroides]